MISSLFFDCMLVRGSQVHFDFFGSGARGITLFFVRKYLIVCLYMWHRCILTSLVAVQGAFPSSSLGTALCCPRPCCNPLCGPCNLHPTVVAQPIVNHNSGLGEQRPAIPGGRIIAVTAKPATEATSTSTYHRSGLKKVHKPSNQF